MLLSKQHSYHPDVDMECLPLLSPQLVVLFLQGCGNFGRWGPYWRKRVTRGIHRMSTSLSPCPLLPIPPCSSYQDVLAKSMKPSKHKLGPLTPQANVNLSSLKWFG